MKVKLAALFLLAFTLVSLCSCASAKSDQNGVVIQFCEAMTAFDFDGMQKCVSPSHENIKTAFLSQNKFMDVLFDFFGENIKNTTYKISKTEVNGDTATVTVDFGYGDYNILYREAFASMLMKTLSMPEDKVTAEKMKELLGPSFDEVKGSFPKASAKSAVVFHCVKEDENGSGAWVIKEYDGKLYNIMSQSFTATVTDIGGALSQ